MCCEQRLGLFFWEKGPAMLGLRQACLGRCFYRCMETGACVSKLDSKCRSCAGSSRWPCAYAEGWGGKRCLLVPLFLEVSLCMRSLWDMLQNEQITSQLCAPGALQITVFSLYVSGLFACILSKSSSAVMALSKPSPLTFRTPCTEPSLLSEVTKFGPSTLQANCSGDSFTPSAPGRSF